MVRERSIDRPASANTVSQTSENAFSIGLKSGQYGGRNNICAPATLWRRVQRRFCARGDYRGSRYRLVAALVPRSAGRSARGMLMAPRGGEHLHRVNTHTTQLWQTYNKLGNQDRAANVGSHARLTCRAGPPKPSRTPCKAAGDLIPVPRSSDSLGISNASKW